jgi:hypothetical protein
VFSRGRTKLRKEEPRVQNEEGIEEHIFEGTKNDER